jgi:histidine triad (HIT) family protein
MYTHAPADYRCHFCLVAAGEDSPYPYNTESDVVVRHVHATAFVATDWWPNNPGHVQVIPNRHIEHIYLLTSDLAIHVHDATQQIALAMKEAYGCGSISTLQHNEPTGSQHSWHDHLHVLPRFVGDRLYDLTHERHNTTPEARLPYDERLRAVLRQRTSSDTH